MGLLLHQNRLIRSRLAPTPSGFLHTGNAVNFAITAALTHTGRGSLVLRIDDLDAERVRAEYVQDIFEILEWLEIPSDSGPRNQGEVSAFSQKSRVPEYIRLIERLKETGHVYACTCSRREIEDRTGTLVYDGHCRSARHPLANDRVLRFALPDSPVVVHDVLRGALSVNLSSLAGDPVIRRRDGLPAYHIASLADDVDQRINLIVRGEDLLPSTATQLVLARALGEQGVAFGFANFLHHGLLVAEDGRKLSKSQGDSPLRTKRLAGVSPAIVYQAAAQLMGVPRARNLSELAERLGAVAAQFHIETL